MDHVIPKSKGGPHRAWNIVISCHPCNQDKGDSNPTHKQLDIILRWKMAHESRISVEKAIAMAKRLGDEVEVQELLKVRGQILDVIHARTPKKIFDIRLKVAS